MLRRDDTNPVGVFRGTPRVAEEYEGLSALLPMTVEHMRCFFSDEYVLSSRCDFPAQERGEEGPYGKTLRHGDIQSMQ